MVLTEDLFFKGSLQKSNRVQIPVLIRELYNLQSGETFKVSLGLHDSFKREIFYVRLQKDGRFTVPKPVINVLDLEPNQILSVKIFKTNKTVND